MGTYFKKVETLEELRKQYKELLKKFHPDNKRKSTQATQEINSEYDNLFKILKNQHKEGSEKQQRETDSQYNIKIDKELREQLNKIINLDVEIEIIGNWIWVSGKTYPVKDILKSAGFAYSSRNKAWYWGKVAFFKKSHKTLNMETKRALYGSMKIESEKMVLIGA